MKQVFLVVTLLVGFIFASCVGPSFGAEQKAEKNRWTAVYDADLFTRYMSINAGEFYPKPVFQHSITFTDTETGLWISPWHSISPFDPNNDGGDEVDLSVGKTGHIGDISTDFAVNYYNVSDLSETRGDFLEITAKLSYSVDNLSFYTKWGWLSPVDDIADGDISYRACVKYTFDVAHEPYIEAQFGGVEGSGNNGRVTGGADIGGFRVNLNAQDDLRTDSVRVWAGIGRSFNL